MLAAYFSLKCFANNLLKLNNKNTCKLSKLNKNTCKRHYSRSNSKNMGTSHNELLNKSCNHIWEWCKNNNTWLLSVYVNTKHNLLDEPSRKFTFQEKGC